VLAGDTRAGSRFSLCADTLLGEELSNTRLPPSLGRAKREHWTGAGRRRCGTGTASSASCAQ
jgi:hypothetical protein